MPAAATIGAVHDDFRIWPRSLHVVVHGVTVSVRRYAGIHSALYRPHLSRYPRYVGERRLQDLHDRRAEHILFEDQRHLGLVGSGADVVVIEGVAVSDDPRYWVAVIARNHLRAHGAQTLGRVLHCVVVLGQVNYGVTWRRSRRGLR